LVVELFGDLIAAQFRPHLPAEATDVIVGCDGPHHVTLAWQFQSGARLEGPTVAEYDAAGPFGFSILEDTLGLGTLVDRLAEYVAGRRPWPARFGAADVARCRAELQYLGHRLVDTRPACGPLTEPPTDLTHLVALVRALRDDPIRLQGIYAPIARLRAALLILGYQIEECPAADDTADLRASRPPETWNFAVDCCGDGDALPDYIDAVNPDHCWKWTVTESEDLGEILREVNHLGGRAEIRVHQDGEEHPVVTIHELPQQQ
jgi:hypothetical protein